MRAEYLIFHLVVVAMPLLLARWPPTDFRRLYLPAFLSCLVVAVPYLLWDSLATGTHWDFNPAYVLGPRLFGLPIEEVLFFFTVPFACLYTWIILLRGEDAPIRPRLRGCHLLLFAALPLGVWVLSLGKAYTGWMLIALGIAAALDLLLRTSLAMRPKFWALVALVVCFTLIFNGYLTARPVVTYHEPYQIGVRVLTIPIEDFGYGIGLVYACLAVFVRMTARESPFLNPRIERAFRGYRHLANVIDETRPIRSERASRTAVIGGGLAGLTAATYLADRGFSVTLFEAKHYLGGKCGSWPTALEDGARVQAEHGFHAFFRQYYNLRRLLAHVGVASRLRAIDDYLIVGEDGARYSFRHVATTPGMNLVSLAWNGVYRLGPVVLGGAGSRMESFLRYERDATFAEYDEMSFDAWAKAAMLPRSLELLFTTFARAFFADRERMSMAELIKGFHFYYLSNDCGLLYDHLTVDHEPGLIAPLRKRLEQHGARIELATPVRSLEKTGAGFELQGRVFDDVVLATSVPGTRAIVSGAHSLAQSELARRVETLRTGQRYAVLRLWLDREVGADWPVFVITERRRLLDAVAFVHRAQSTAGAWAEERSGAVVELHCYAVPDALADDMLRDALMRDLAHFRPGIAQARILGENLEIGRDMTAFHTGLFANRPEVDNGVEGLYLAGDWVKLPYPAMLMEAACMSGLLSANAILRRHGLREEPVYTVPLRGLLAQRPRVQCGAS